MSNRCACGTEYDIYTVRPDGSALVQLTSSPGEDGYPHWSPDSRRIAFGRDPDSRPGIWLVPREGGPTRHLRPEVPRVSLRGVSDWAADGSFLMTGIPNGTDRSNIYWVDPYGAEVQHLVEDADEGVWRPLGAARSIARLSLSHHWAQDHSRLVVAGQLTLDGRPVAGREIIVGRIGEHLPTRHLTTLVTDRTGAFRVQLTMRTRASQDPVQTRWRVLTAYFDGSPTEWSTVAFDPL